MINRFALSFLCIELHRTRNVQVHACSFTTSMRSQGKRPGRGSRQACRPRRCFRRVTFRLKTLTGHYSIFKFDLSSAAKTGRDDVGRDQRDDGVAASSVPTRSGKIASTGEETIRTSHAPSDCALLQRPCARLRLSPARVFEGAQHRATRQAHLYQRRFNGEALEACIRDSPAETSNETH